MELTVRDLPTLNAALNATSGVLLVLGWLLIRRGKIEAHRRAMISAFGCSIVFLVSYLVYHFQVGSVRFQGTGTVRTVYLTILLTHTVLAAAVPFLAVMTLSRALARRFAQAQLHFVSIDHRALRKAGGVIGSCHDGRELAGFRQSCATPRSQPSIQHGNA